jgi:hypothetical protein
VQRQIQEYERAGLLPSQRHKPNTWRTRKDPFAEVFESELVPLFIDTVEALEAAHPFSLEQSTRGPEI